MHTETIGNGETFTTIQGWENGRDGVLTEIEKGQCKAEAFDEDVTFAGSDTAIDKYMWLTSVDGAEHDGRSNEVSSAGNARIEGSTNVGKVAFDDEWVRMDWMEMDCDSTGADTLLSMTATASTMYVHHMLIHNDGKSTAAQFGVFLNDADITLFFYRNIVYGNFKSGTWILSCAVNTEAFNNTFYANNLSNGGGDGGLECDDADATLLNNVSFNLAGDANSVREGNGTWNYNATNDGTATGANSIATVSDVTNELTNPTPTYANTDLTIKDTDAEIYQAGLDHDAEADELDVPITDRSATISSNWSMGADDIIPVADVVIFRRRRAG